MLRLVTEPLNCLNPNEAVFRSRQFKNKIGVFRCAVLKQEINILSFERQWVSQIISLCFVAVNKMQEKRALNSGINLFR